MAINTIIPNYTTRTVKALAEQMIKGSQESGVLQSRGTLLTACIMIYWHEYERKEKRLLANFVFSMFPKRLFQKFKELITP